MANRENKAALADYLKNHKNPQKPKTTPKPRPEISKSGSSYKSQNGNNAEARSAHTPGRSKASSSNSSSRDELRPNKTSYSGGARPKTTQKPRRNKILENKLAIMKSYKPKMEYMPDEILLHIFSFLPPNSILMIASVCKRWLQLSNDNILWHNLYQKYGKELLKRGTKEPKRPSELPASYWKKQCIDRGTDYRNKKVIPLLKKKSRFSGLPEKTKDSLIKAGVSWQLSLIDSRDNEISFPHSDVFYFTMSACARWCSLPDCPTLQSVKTLRLFASNPVFYSKKGDALPNSPCQRSILYSTPLKWSNFVKENPPIGSDETVNLYALSDSVIIATWKDKSEIAFVAVSFHFHELVKRCLLGNSSVPYMPPPHRPTFSDIDRRYGLHSYRCSMELRNQRTSLWSELFMNLNALPDLKDGHAEFQLIDPDRSYQRSWVEKEIIFPWRTDVLRGKVKDVSILDVTVLDDQEHPMWCGSECVKITAPGADKVDYEYDGDYFQISYRDSFGKVKMLLIWEPQNKKYYITSLLLSISLQCINSWFGTRY